MASGAPLSKAGHEEHEGKTKDTKEEKREKATTDGEDEHRYRWKENVSGIMNCSSSDLI
jgi:hypothetical protein